MTGFEVYNDIKEHHPELVENLLERSACESEFERQTIYGDLSDWLRDYYTLIPLAQRDIAAKLLIGDYVIRHPHCLRKNINK